MTGRTSPAQSSDNDYDALDRLIEDTIDNTTSTLSYDSNGNRLSRVEAGVIRDFYTYQADSNRLAQVASVQTGGTPLSAVPSHDLVYNGANRLSRLVEDGVLKAEYIYNANGQRTRKTVYQSDGVSVAGITVYHYDLAGRLLSETREDGTLLRDYPRR